MIVLSYVCEIVFNLKQKKMARVRLLIVSFIVILLDSCQGEVIITDLDGTTAIAQFRSMAASFGQSIPKGMFIILCTDKTYV